MVECEREEISRVSPGCASLRGDETREICPSGCRGQLRLDSVMKDSKEVVEIGWDHCWDLVLQRKGHRMLVTCP